MEYEPRGRRPPGSECATRGGVRVRLVRMLLREVEYARPETVDEAVRLLSSREDARALAGGQSLVNVMKTRVAAPELVVDLNRIEELRGISNADDGSLVARRHGHVRRADPIGRGARCPADPGRGCAHDRRRAGPEPRHGRRQPLRQRPDEPPAAADGDDRRDDDHPRARGRADGDLRRVLRGRLPDGCHAGRDADPRDACPRSRPERATAGLRSRSARKAPASSTSPPPSATDGARIAIGCVSAVPVVVDRRGRRDRGAQGRGGRRARPAGRRPRVRRLPSPPAEVLAWRAVAQALEGAGV